MNDAPRTTRGYAPQRALAVALAAAAIAACGSTGHHSVHSAAHTATPQAALAQSFASTYLRYIDGLTPARVLPGANAAVQAEAIAGGQIPARYRQGSLRLVSLRPAQGVPGALIITAANSLGTLYAQETLTHTPHGWRVTNLMAPDFEQAFVKQSTATIPPPTGSAPARAVAQEFVDGYLPWYYGHGSVRAIRDASPALIAHLAAHPPNIPPSLMGLHGRAAAIGMQKDSSGWLALVDVTDGHETYQLNLTLVAQHGRWLVTTVTSS